MKESKKTEKKENQKEKKQNNDIRIIKNVIGISLVFIFLSSILLTGFFALKDMNSSNIKKINNTLERPNFGSGNILVFQEDHQIFQMMDQDQKDQILMKMMKKIIKKKVMMKTPTRKVKRKIENHLVQLTI